MANTLTAVIPTIFAQGLLALREYCVMPRLINTSYSTDAEKKGNVVNIPIPSAVSVVAVTPAAYAPDAGASVPTTAQITLDQWDEAAFDMTDRDIAIAVSGVVPGQVSEAIRALSNSINAKILSKYTGFYGYAGVAGTTPFAVDLSEAAAVRRVLNEQLAPKDARSLVLDPDAEEKALNRRALQDQSFRGTNQGLVEGEMGRLLGMNWFMDQQVPTHTAGTAASATTNTAGYAVGVKTVTLASAGTGTILVGDIITFAGDSQTYVVTAGDADVSNGGTVSFEPGLKIALPTSAIAITVKATHVVNLAFHRDALGFASRLMQDAIVNDSDRQAIRAIADPVSGLTLRLEVRREHKRTRWAFDILYGVSIVRRELGARLAG